MFLLEQEGKDNLVDFANIGIGDIDYQAYLTEVTNALTDTYRHNNPRHLNENHLIDR